MKKIFKKLIGVILSVVCICGSFGSCSVIEIIFPNSSQSPIEKEEKILIFSSDNSVPLTGKTYKGLDTASVAVPENERPEAVKDIAVAKIETTKNVYLHCPYTATQIEEYKEQGFTHLSFYLYAEDEHALNCGNNYVNGQWGLLSRDTRGTLFRVDEPTVYSIKIKIDTLLLEMTDTSDDNRTDKDVTKNEQEILLTSKFWDVSTNFVVLYFSDMYLTKEPQGTKTTPALWPNDNRG